MNYETEMYIRCLRRGFLLSKEKLLIPIKQIIQRKHTKEQHTVYKYNIIYIIYSNNCSFYYPLLLNTTQENELAKEKK